MKKITIGILAHVDSGKTTLSESMLYFSGKIRKVGRVDHGNAYLDTHKLEKNRGITIFSKQARLQINDTQIELLDTPGHVDFSTEMERTLQVLDYAILVISGSDMVQGHTETLWSLLQKYKIPTFIFDNKMDLAGVDKDEILFNLKKNLSEHCVDFKDENYIENTAVCSDQLTEEFLINNTLKTKSIINAISSREVFPCYFGSALKLEGVEMFLNELDTYTVQKQYPKQFGAKVFKILWDDQGNRLSYIKITGGNLKVKTSIYGEDKEKNQWDEKINQIRLYSGAKFTAVDEVSAGDICAVTGLSYTYVGQGLGSEKNSTKPMLEPVLTYQVILPIDIDPYTALGKFKILEQEDPELHVVWNEKTKEINIQLMGVIQLEILQSIISERFGIYVDFDSGSIVYKETIEDCVTGVGHFEPLKHYAEVHLKMEKASRGSGIILENKAKHDLLDKNWQNLILTHLMEKKHLGVLTGSEITDIKITLIDGRSHLKHTEGGDFRQATYRAVRHGLMQAKNQLLEPVYAFKLDIPTENIGRALSDIQQMGGSFEDPITNNESTRIEGLVPVETSRDYQKEVIKYTRGRGKFNCVFHGYDNCHNSDEVIKAINYNPESDLENSPDSVFCSHGAGFNVKWDKVTQYMHIKIDTRSYEESSTKVRRASSIIDKGRSIQDDKELLSIFENTYGKIKNDPRIGFSAVKKAENNTNYKRSKEDILTGPEFILVDGYNIIFAWEELNSLAKINIEAARNKLIDAMINYSAYKENNLILVFDAYKLKGGRGSVEKYGCINVVYTKEAETADMYIEKVTHEIGKKHRVRVATSDAMEQMIILGHGASRISALGFKEEVLGVEKAIREILENQR